MKLITNELLPVYQNEIGEKVIDARELHSFLEVGKDFSTWIKERIQKYGFIENEDFSPNPGKSSGGRPTIEYTLKMEMAKELCMVENNDQGSRARKYFIEVEKRFKEQSLDLNDLSPQLQFMIQLEKRQKGLEQGLSKLQLVVDNEVWLTENQKCEIQETVNKRVGELRKMGYPAHYQSIYRTLKSHFSVSKYDKIARKDFYVAMDLVKGWFPRKKAN